MRIWILACIVVVALVVRVIGLGTYPAGFNADEAAFGYNGYSLLKTGRDEWGRAWWQLPITNLKSFGDYKLPLYAYLTVPAIKVFGLNEFATRLPNAVVGTLAVLAVFCLTRRLFPKTDPVIAVMASVFLGISPWHISMSRGAFEANLATLFFPLVLALFIRGKYTLSVILLALGFYSYHTTRLLSPVLLLGMLLVGVRTGMTKKIWVAAILAGLLMFPGIVSMMGKGATRLSDLTIIGPDSWSVVSERRFNARNAGLPDVVARVVNNKVAYVAQTFTSNYLNYFSPQFLFSQGVAEATYGMMPGKGVLYWIYAPLLALFVVRLIRNPSGSNWVLLGLILISPIPASLVKGSGFAGNRTIVMMPFLAIAAAVGLSQIRKVIWPVVAGIALVSVISFGIEYRFRAPAINGPSMSYGWRQAYERLVNISENYDEIHVSRSLSEPHIFTAFYLKIDPSVYQLATTTWGEFDARKLKFLDQLDGYWLGKYRFGDLHLSDSANKNVLVIAKFDELPANSKEYFHLDYPNGTSAIKVVPRQDL